MANWSDPRIGASQPGTTTTVGQDVAFDAGLRSHMLSVYNYMTSGVLLTGIVALLFAQGGENSLAFRLFVGGGPLVVWAAILAPLGVVMWLNFGINRISTGTARILFWVYAGLLGVSLSTIFFVYTAGSIATAFFATAAGFASLSLWGYTTKRDLSGMGTFLIMGLFGLIVVLFLPEVPLSQRSGVLIFAGLTAYDTQKIKSLYFAVAGTDFHGKAVVMGALTLYLDFINLFLFLLRFMGNRN